MLLNKERIKESKKIALVRIQNRFAVRVLWHKFSVDAFYE